SSERCRKLRQSIALFREINVVAPLIPEPDGDRSATTATPALAQIACSFGKNSAGSRLKLSPLTWAKATWNLTGSQGSHWISSAAFSAHLNHADTDPSFNSPALRNATAPSCSRYLTYHS